jgi:shikimate dehydrogenase
MHLAGYRALGLSFTYVPFAVEDLEGALRGMRALGIRGFGVSMPFKLDVIPLLDRLDPLAERIGAVNTVVNDDGVLVGHNTDAWGAARALEEAMVLSGRRAVIIGAGGAARAVAFSLVQEGMRVHVVNRTRAKAERLAEDIGGATAGGLEDLASLQGADAVINCSSAGMSEYGAESPVPETALRPGLVVMDIVYKPIQTELVRLAERVGASAVHGGRMLLHQAARQFRLYTGQEAPLPTMDDAMRQSMR